MRFSIVEVVRAFAFAGVVAFVAILAWLLTLPGPPSDPDLNGSKAPARSRTGMVPGTEKSVVPPAAASFVSPSEWIDEPILGK